MSVVENPPKIRIRMPRLYPKQQHAFFTSARISLCHASTKAGKTVGALTWQFSQCWGDGAGKSHLWVSPIYAQATNVFERVCRMMLRADPKKQTWDANKSTLVVTFSNGSRWYFKGADNPDSIYGADHYSVVVDEASRCKSAAWDAVVSTTTKTRGPIRAIGNVVGRRDWFYHLAAKAKAGEPGMAYSLITWKDAVEAGVLEESTVDEQRRMLPPNVFDALYNCIPAEDGANPFGYDALRACVRPLSTAEPVAFGVDLAKSHDWVVVVGLDANRQVCRFARWQAPWEVTGPRVVSMIGDCPALIDSSGVGDPVVERIMRQCPMVEGYQTGAKKIALIHGLIMSVQQGRVHFPEESPECPILPELMAYEYSLTPTGKISYSAPAGAHDDCVIALALADLKADQIGASPEVFAESVSPGGLVDDDEEDRMWTPASGW